MGSELTYGEAVAGALNVVVVAWLSLAAAVLALGWAPRAVSLIGSIPVVGGFVLWVLADTLGWPDWVGLLSPFTHVARVPAEAVDWPAQAGMLAIVARSSASAWSASPVATYADEMRGVSSFPAQQQRGRPSRLSMLEPAGRAVGS